MTKRRNSNIGKSLEILKKILQFKILEFVYLYSTFNSLLFSCNTLKYQKMHRRYVLMYFIDPQQFKKNRLHFQGVLCYFHEFLSKQGYK